MNAPFFEAVIGDLGRENTLLIKRAKKQLKTAMESHHCKVIIDGSSEPLFAEINGCLEVNKIAGLIAVSFDGKTKVCTTETYLETVAGALSNISSMVYRQNLYGVSRRDLEIEALNDIFKDIYASIRQGLSFDYVIKRHPVTDKFNARLKGIFTSGSWDIRAEHLGETTERNSLSVDDAEDFVDEFTNNNFLAWLNMGVQPVPNWWR